MDQLDKCPKCEAPTVYREKPNGDGSLGCSECDWQAVKIEWIASAKKPKRLA